MEYREYYGTPSPWELTPDTGGDGTGLEVTYNNKVVCDLTYSRNRSHDPMLIAMAPDLLDISQRLCIQLEKTISENKLTASKETKKTILAAYKVIASAFGDDRSYLE